MRVRGAGWARGFGLGGEVGMKGMQQINRSWNEVRWNFFSLNEVEGPEPISMRRKPGWTCGGG